jgi:hypothetical protein
LKVTDNKSRIRILLFSTDVPYQNVADPLQWFGEGRV